ncbi:MAG: hypothetical protein J7L86_05615 [Candidatus Marinimicrobia bacterium]|nr:hypothetical protein [Candidatus Neomarinimicrobiota bacterium]
MPNYRNYSFRTRVGQIPQNPGRQRPTILSVTTTFLLFFGKFQALFSSIVTIGYLEEYIKPNAGMALLLP